MPVFRETARYSPHDDPSDRWYMVVDGVTVSELWLDLDSGEVLQVETVERFQRLGCASELFRVASLARPVFHAPEAHRTFAGDRFARSVGGESLECRHGCCSE